MRFYTFIFNFVKNSNLHKPYILLIIILIIAPISGCQHSENTIAEFTSDFESGSIGTVEQIDQYNWTISLKNDNGDNSLPDSWRCWWYLRIDNTPIDATMVINLKNRGWPYYYVPVYSYDNETWHRFSEDEVSQPLDYELSIKKQFTNKQVWLARFYPYTFSQLHSYLEKIESSPLVHKEVIGQTAYNRPITMLTITDFNTSDKQKKRIWIHARTHPAETGSSFLLEGLINFLLSDVPDAKKTLSNLIFHIVPMQNVDGVISGNYRSTPDTLNLEVMWYPDLKTPDPLDLSSDAPPEVQALNQTIRKLLQEDAPFSIALNLHSSNSEPDTAPFFFPHFGSESSGYSVSEVSLWDSQIAFIKHVASFYNNKIEPIPLEGGSYFADKYYPESWWWKNFNHEIMAITMETVYGRAGFAPDWLTPNELRELGKAVGLAMMAYHDIPVEKLPGTLKLQQTTNKNMLRFPNLYPPKAKDEGKE